MFSTVGLWCQIGIWICGCTFFINTLVPEDISIYCATHAGEALKPTQSPVDALCQKTHARGIDCDHDGFISSNVAWTFWRLIFALTWFWIQMDLVTNGHPRNSKEAIQSTNPNQQYLTIHRMILSLFHSSWTVVTEAEICGCLKDACIWPNFFHQLAGCREGAGELHNCIVKLAVYISFSSRSLLSFSSLYCISIKHRWSKHVPVWELNTWKTHTFGLVKRLVDHPQMLEIEHPPIPSYLIWHYYTYKDIIYCKQNVNTSLYLHSCTRNDPRTWKTFWMGALISMARQNVVPWCSIPVCFGGTWEGLRCLFCFFQVYMFFVDINCFYKCTVLNSMSFRLDHFFSFFFWGLDFCAILGMDL